MLHSDHCVVDFPYPGWDKAQQAGMIIVRHLTGAEKQELPCLAHCGWVAQGFAQSLALPHDTGPLFSAGKKQPLPPTKTPKQKAKLLEQAFTAQGGPKAETVPWPLVFMVLKELLELWLKRRK